MKLSESKTFCPVSHSQLWIDQWGSCRLCALHDVTTDSLMQGTPATSAYKMSLRQPLLWHAHGLQEIWQSADAVALRRSQDSGQWPEQCRICKRAESSGTISARRTAVGTAADTTDTLQELHLDLGAHSQLRPVFGSVRDHIHLRSERQLAIALAKLPASDPQKLALPRWMQEWYADLPESFGWSQTDIMVASDMAWLLSDVSLANLREVGPQLRQLTISGSDPLRLPTLADLLIQLRQVNGGTCAVELQTQLTDVDQRVVDAAAAFDNNLFQLTIEGHGEVDQWLRYQSHWHVTTAMLDQLCAVSSANIKIYTNVSAINAAGLIDLLRWLRDVAERHQRLITWTPVHQESIAELSLHALPQKAKQQLVAELAELRSQRDMQWPLYSWNGIDQLMDLLVKSPASTSVQQQRLRQFMDYQQALRQCELVRAYLGYGEDPDWRVTFAKLDSWLDA